MRVAARAERGRANEAVLELIAATVAVPRNRVTLVAGGSEYVKRAVLPFLPARVRLTPVARVAAAASA